MMTLGLLFVVLMLQAGPDYYCLVNGFSIPESVIHATRTGILSSPHKNLESFPSPLRPFLVSGNGAPFVGSATSGEGVPGCGDPNPTLLLIPTDHVMTIPASVTVNHGGGTVSPSLLSSSSSLLSSISDTIDTEAARAASKAAAAAVGLDINTGDSIINLLDGIVHTLCVAGKFLLAAVVLLPVCGILVGFGCGLWSQWMADNLEVEWKDRKPELWDEYQSKLSEGEKLSDRLDLAIMLWFQLNSFTDTELMEYAQRPEYRDIFDVTEKIIEDSDQIQSDLEAIPGTQIAINYYISREIRKREAALKSSSS